MIDRQKLVRGGLTVLASLVAVVLALAICGVLLAATGQNPFSVYGKMVSYGIKPKQLLDMLQRATPLALSGVAVAIGFKMNLFNIGVEGQAYFAAFCAAVVGQYLDIPAVFAVSICLIVAMVAGAGWAGIAGVLKVKRGVNEVISTIMLNAIALGVVDWLFNEFFRDNTGSLDTKTKPIASQAWIPDLVENKLSGFVFGALIVAILYGFIVWFTPFGFRLRATGSNPVAAHTAGVSSGAMSITAMLMSGAVAGLVLMPALLGDIHAFGQGLPDGLGFAGIAVALLGRNNPIGILVSALLFAFLAAASPTLQLEGVPPEIVQIIQGVIVLTVVIANEAFGRIYERSVQNNAAKRLDSAPPSTPVAAATAAVG